LEELGVQSDPVPFAKPTEVAVAGESPLLIQFVETEIQGEPKLLEHENMGWFSVEELLELDLAPADAEFAMRHILMD
jgi:hypothetical protein